MLDREPIPHGFNVSHSGAHGLIGFSWGASLGVDVEERSLRRPLAAIGERMFRPNERAALASTHGRDKLHLFYKIWTIREALIKATGKGFSCDPSGFEVPPAMLCGGRSGTIRFDDAESETWCVRDIGEARFAAAIAY